MFWPAPIRRRLRRQCGCCCREERVRWGSSSSPPKKLSLKKSYSSDFRQHPHHPLHIDHHHLLELTGANQAAQDAMSWTSEPKSISFRRPKLSKYCKIPIISVQFIQNATWKRPNCKSGDDDAAHVGGGEKREEGELVTNQTKLDKHHLARP